MMPTSVQLQKMLMRCEAERYATQRSDVCLKAAIRKKFQFFEQYGRFFTEVSIYKYIFKD
jgi:hypothetical protein